MFNTSSQHSTGEMTRVLLSNSENNSEICRLQTRWEAAAWESPSAAQALRRAVAWMRQNPESTAAEAERRFLQ